MKMLMLILNFIVLLLAFLMPLSSSYAINNSIINSKTESIKPNLLINAKPNTWIQIPNTKLKNVVGAESYKQPIRAIVGPRAIIDAWNGAVWNEKEQRLDIIAAGGHADYCGNGYYRFDLDDMQWSQIIPPSKLDGFDQKTGVAPDGRPLSRHTYQGQVYVPTTDKTYMFGGSLCLSGGADHRNWSFTSKGDFEYLGKQRGYPSLGGHALFDPVTGYIFLLKRGHVYQFDIASNNIRDLTSREADRAWGSSAAIDIKRRIIFVFGHKYAWLFNIESGTKKNIKLTGDFSLLNHKGVGMEFVKSIDRYVIWAGGSTMYFVDPVTFNFTPMKTKGLAPKGNGNGVYGRFRYSEKYGGFIVVSRFNEDVYFLKLGEFPKQATSNIKLSNINPQKFIDNSSTGDIVTINPGNYLGGLKINKAITLNLKGVNLWGVSGGKGILNIDNPGGSVIINDFVGQGVRAGANSGNLAGIKIAGKNFDVTINRANISGSVMGIMTDNRGGILRIIDSYIHDTGNSNIKTSLSHIVYAGNIDELQVINTRIERSHAQGHLFKSRALVSSIINSKLLGGNSRHSRIIDLPCGGKLTIVNTKMTQSPRADNLDLIGLGLESCGVGKPINVLMKHSSITATKPGSILYSVRTNIDMVKHFINGGNNSFKGIISPW